MDQYILDIYDKTEHHVGQHNTYEESVRAYEGYVGFHSCLRVKCLSVFQTISQIKTCIQASLCAFVCVCVHMHLQTPLHICVYLCLYLCVSAYLLGSTELTGPGQHE